MRNARAAYKCAMQAWHANAKSKHDLQNAMQERRANAKRKCKRSSAKCKSEMQHALCEQYNSDKKLKTSRPMKTRSSSTLRQRIKTNLTQDETQVPHAKADFKRDMRTWNANATCECEI
jgi:hypothetical protein